MLVHLRCRNLGVIEDAALDPDQGLTVITGETGTGKTMLLGALRLLLGEKPQPSLVGPFAEEARADGLFALEELELGVGRVVPRDGRSRAYLDGNLVSAETLGERIGELVDIIAQHDHLSLRRPGEMLRLLDGALDDPGRAERYRRAWQAQRRLLSDRERLGGDGAALARQAEQWSHQAAEIEAAGLQAGDDVRLDAMAARLRHAEALATLLHNSLRLLEVVDEAAGGVVADTRRIAAIDPSLEAVDRTAEDLARLGQELARTLRTAAEDLEGQAGDIGEAESRLTVIGDLKRKYGPSIDDVIDAGLEAKAKAAELGALLDRAERLDTDLEQAGAELWSAALELSEARRGIAALIEGRVVTHLADLGMPKAHLVVSFEEVDPGPTGRDRVTLLFASDKRLRPGPVHEVASGGELSRLVLALRLAVGSGGARTLVFDEIDAGVGGVTALALGRKLGELAGQAQVLCVTHLPQVAAQASTHYVLERKGATGTLRRIQGEERITELTRMLAGMPESASGRETAAELMAAVDG